MGALCEGFMSQEGVQSCTNDRAEFKADTSFPVTKRTKGNIEAQARRFSKLWEPKGKPTRQNRFTLADTRTRRPATLTQQTDLIVFLLQGGGGL